MIWVGEAIGAENNLIPVGHNLPLAGVAMVAAEFYGVEQPERAGQGA